MTMQGDRVQNTERGQRLREERERLNMTLVKMAGRGGVSRGSQILYEKGNPPTADYLAAISKAGADVLFILTGVRSALDTAGFSNPMWDATEEQRGPINPLLFKFCADIVASEYSRADIDLPKMAHFMEAVWAYNELMARLSDPSDGDKLDATLPKIRGLLSKRLKGAMR